ncbi:hypothetical protein SDJN02_07422, partial [Cucurbita argyrosperma subsp. argyrosperma]
MMVEVLGLNFKMLSVLPPLGGGTTLGLFSAADDKQQPKRENRHLSTPNQAAPPLLQLKVLGKPKPLLTDSWSASKGCVSSFFSSTNFI